jgi:hypothetical protein
MLIQTGELLAATSEIVTRRSDGEKFDIKRVTIFDTDAGKPVELGTGLNFPGVDFRNLQELAPQRPRVSLKCSLYKGNLQIEEVLEAELPAHAAK